MQTYNSKMLFALFLSLNQASMMVVVMLTYNMLIHCSDNDKWCQANVERDVTVVAMACVWRKKQHVRYMIIDLTKYSRVVRC